MNCVDINKAIKFLKPTAEFSFQDDDYSTIKWDVLEGDAPTWSEIEAAHLKVQAAEAKEESAKAAKKSALLERLGITEEEAQLLLS